MPSRYRCMRKFPGYQAALLNQNSKDIPTPSDRTCYFFGMPMEIKPVTLHAKTRNKLAVYQVFFGGATRPASGMLSIASCNFRLKPYYESHP